MNRNLQLALAATLGAVAGATGMGLSGGASSTTTLINARLIREAHTDGGYGWSARACAYREANGQHTEPCWMTHVDSSQALSLEAALLDAGR